MTGLADALIMVGLRYGSVDAAERAGDWAQQISRAAYLTSARLAAERRGRSLCSTGRPISPARPSASWTRMSASPGRRAWHSQCAAHLRRTDRHNLAWSQTTSPAASSRSSRWPIRARSLQPDGSRVEEDVSDYALRRFRAHPMGSARPTS